MLLIHSCTALSVHTVQCNSTMQGQTVMQECTVLYLRTYLGVHLEQLPKVFQPFEISGELIESR